MRHKLSVFSIALIAGFFMNQKTKGCDDLVNISSMLSNVSEIKIEGQKLDQCFVDSWIDDIEKSSETVSFSKINTLTIENCKLNKIVSYDIFNEFVNIKELNVLNCRIDSKELNNLLTYINPYSLSILNLSGSNFEFFDEKDFSGINSLFSLREIVLPSNMNKTYQRTLEKLLGHPKIIEQPEFSQGENRLKEKQIDQLIQEKDETIEKQKNLIEHIYVNLISFKNISSKTEIDCSKMIEETLRLIDSAFLNKNIK